MRSSELEIVGTTGAYSEERLFIREKLRELQEKIDDQLVKTGASKELVGKVQRDLNEAHSRVKKLQGFKDTIETRITKLEAKAAYIAAGTGAVVAALSEVGKYLLTHR